MNAIVPLASFPENLRAEINQKLQELQACEQLVPAVFIVHDLRNDSVLYMSERGLRILNTTLDKIRLSNTEYHKRYFNPEDVPNYVPKIFSLIERNNTDEMVSFFQQVRSAPNEEWSWYLSATRIFFRGENGKPLLTLTLSVTGRCETPHYGKGGTPVTGKSIPATAPAPFFCFDQKRN